MEKPESELCDRQHSDAVKMFDPSRKWEISLACASSFDLYQSLKDFPFFKATAFSLIARNFNLSFQVTDWYSEWPAGGARDSW